MAKPTVLKLFLDTHMGLSHHGLAELAKAARIPLRSLAAGDLLLFLNKKGDKMKILGGHGRVIGYLKMLNGQRIEKEALQYIPQTFGSSGFDYDAALLLTLNKKLGIRD